MTAHAIVEEVVKSVDETGHPNCVNEDRQVIGAVFFGHSLRDLRRLTLTQRFRVYSQAFEATMVKVEELVESERGR